jgi:hypothetical protein
MILFGFTLFEKIYGSKNILGNLLKYAGND